MLEVHLAGAEPDEVAAVVVALMAWFDQERAESTEPHPARWVRRGRLESHGVAPSARAMSRSWNI